MGRAKEWQLEQEERGWFDGPDTSVCSDCFDDEVLSDAAREKADAFTCDYCGNTAEDCGDPSVPIAAPFNAMMEVIAEGIYKDWNLADDEGVPYETAEGGYQFSTQDKWHLVYDWVPVSNRKLQKDIVSCLPDQQFCQRNFMSLDPARSMSVDWERFCEIVKHEKRYVFIHPRTPSSTECAEPPEGVEPNVAELRIGDDDVASPEEVLETIANIVKTSDLLRKVPVGTIFKRARIHDAVRRYRSPETLGPSPRHKTLSANRMSSSGISMFYGALDAYTAVAETKTQKLLATEIISIAEFVVTKEFSVVDFSRLPYVPSLFSESTRWERGAISFLHDFVKDLSKPVKRDGRAHIEYLPTQVITEYFRYAFRQDSSDFVRGLYYPSSRAEKGVACVLFFDREDCGCSPESPWLKREAWLKLNRATIERRRGRPRRSVPRDKKPLQTLLFSLE